MRFLVALPISLLLVLTGCPESSPSSSGTTPARGNLRSDASVFHDAIRGAINDNSELQRYFNAIGERLITAAEDRYKQRTPVTFYLCDGETTNVATLGSSNVYITNKLFQACRNEDELAAMMAHGYAHILLRQVAPATGGGDPKKIALATEGMFTSAQEREANQLAYWLYARGGWSPERYGLSSRPLKSTWQPGALPGSARDWRTRPVADDMRFEQYRRIADGWGAKGRPAKILNLIDALPSCVLADDPPAAEARKALKYVPPPPPPPARGTIQKGGGASVVPGT
jgi:hypothetical protein